MDRKGHYLKPATRASAPNVLFALVLTPSVVPSRTRGDADWYEWGGADVCCSHWRRHRWMPLRGARCETPESLWDWMAKHACPRTRNYVVTPNGMETLAVSRHWEHIDRVKVKWIPPGSSQKAGTDRKWPAAWTIVRRAVLTPRCTIFDYARGGLRWLWLSGRQHFDMAEDKIARAVGCEWEDTGDYDPERGHTLHTARARAVLWLRAYQGLCDWWRKNSTAPFGLTAASMAMGVLRSHIEPKAICTHSDSDAHRLERDACHGGRASVWYFGDIGNPRRHSTSRNPAPSRSEYGSIDGPLHLLDVRSMYPWLLRERAFPVKLISYRESMRPGDLLQYARSFGVVARVTMETEVPEYPLRGSEHIYYPVGRFVTTLTGPELLRIAQEGRIAAVHAVSLYQLGRPFREAAGALIGLRESARMAGNEGWEEFAKLTSNALAGKLAQRRGEWQERPTLTARIRYGEWYEVQRGKGTRHRLRAIAGLVWEYEPDATGAGPFTAAFAYLTAYGRLHMRGLRDACPIGSVVSMDTDGLWVGDGAVAALQPKRDVRRATAGDLCLRDTARAARFFGPRHYYTPAGWVLAGFSSPLVKAKTNTVIDTQRYTPLSGECGEAPRRTAVEHRTSTLAIESPGVSVSADGWATPRRRRGTA